MADTYSSNPPSIIPTCPRKNLHVCLFYFPSSEDAIAIYFEVFWFFFKRQFVCSRLVWYLVFDELHPDFFVEVRSPPLNMWGPRLKVSSVCILLCEILKWRWKYLHAWPHHQSDYNSKRQWFLILRNQLIIQRIFLLHQLHHFWLRDRAV